MQHSWVLQNRLNLYNIDSEDAVTPFQNVSAVITNYILFLSSSSAVDQVRHLQAPKSSGNFTVV